MLEYLGAAGNIGLIVLIFSGLIFIHELGHFVAAIFVGVRPERFFIGFDVFGLAIKKKYRGCVYGIGLLPLGGYVKLAGQSDDPREQTGATDDPADYRNKPLWARALIITAGVLMNMLFGFAALVYMYLRGMPSLPATVGVVAENSSAYYAGIKIGDKILAIDDHAVKDFNFLREYVAMNGGRDGDRVFNLTINRENKIINRAIVGQPNPDVAGLVMIGIEPARTTQVAAIEGQQSARNDAVAAGDEIIKVADTTLDDPLFDGGKFAEIIQQNAGKILSATVKRKTENGEIEKEISLPVAAVGAYNFGYTAAIGVADVIADYPAERAGLAKGDRIIGARIGDEKISLLSREQLSRLIRSRAYQPVELTVKRGDEEIKLIAPTLFSGGDPRVPEKRDSFLGVLTATDNANGGERVISVFPEANTTLAIDDVIVKVSGKNFADLGAAVAEAACQEIGLIIAGKGEIIARPQINRLNGVPLAGIMMETLPEILKVEPESQAAKFLSPGDFIIETIIFPTGETTVYWSNSAKKAQKPVSFTASPSALSALRESGFSELTGVLPTVGFAMTQVIQRENFGTACVSAAKDSVAMSLTVYKLLHRLITRKISAEAMSGPVGIIRFMSATLKSPDPFMQLLKLLALISINLAVFNLLPFPVLDGGHLVFIIIEAIKGSPPGEKLREITQYFGVVCLIALMLYVSVNDVSRLVKDTRDSSMLEYKPND